MIAIFTVYNCRVTAIPIISVLCLIIYFNTFVFCYAVLYFENWIIDSSFICIKGKLKKLFSSVIVQSWDNAIAFGITSTAEGLEDNIETV